MLGEVPTVQPELVGDFGTLMDWADARPPAAGPHQCRDPARLPHRARVRRRGHRPVPDRAYVLRCRADHQRPPDDPRRGRGRPPRRARQAAARAARRLRARSSGSWPACRSPSACSTRRSTNSCRTARRSSPRSRRPPGVGVETLQRRAAELHEFNPMLGHRGCRLGITYPEIYEMQARAIFEAAVAVARESGEAPIPEVMVPLVATRRRARDHPRADRPHRRGRVRGAGRVASTIWSAR